jgi:hypothetical protein
MLCRVNRHGARPFKLENGKLENGRLEGSELRLLRWMIGVSPWAAGWPRAAFSRRRWDSRVASTTWPESGPDERQNISRSTKPRSARSTAAS